MCLLAYLGDLIEAAKQVTETRVVNRLFEHCRVGGGV